MTAAPERDDSRPEPREDADLLDYALLGHVAAFVLRAPSRHRLVALTCFLAMAGASVAALKILPKRYRVEAVVLALPNPLSLEFDQFDAPTRAARELVMQRDNLVSLLEQTSFPARHAATRSPAGRAREWVLRLLGRPKPSREQVLEDLADSLEERLQVWVSQSGTITFKFEWSNRELARDLVDAAVRSFLEARHASDVARVEEAISILEEHASRLGVEVAEKTERLVELERTPRAARGPAPAPEARASPPPDPELPTLRRQLTAKQHALAAVEEYRQRQATELQVQLLQQEQIYAEQHPAVAATRRTIEALAGPSPRVEVLRKEIADLEADMKLRGAGPRDLAPRITPQEDPKLDYARHNMWLLVRQHSALLERIDMARVELDTARTGFKYRYSVITPPLVPKGPVRPNAPKVLAMGVAAGVCLALFAAVFLDLASGRIFERWQIERRLGVQVLAELRDWP